MEKRLGLRNFMDYHHIPVLTREVLAYLDPKPNENFIDATLGLGGHTLEILKKTAPNGKILAIDQDLEGINEAKKRLQEYKNRIIYINNNNVYLDKIIRNSGYKRVSGIVFDLGFASWQVENDLKGLSFSSSAPLDMRMSADLNLTASEILNKYPEKKLANLFYEYGDVRGSRRLASKIIEKRRNISIDNTTDLVDIIGTKNPKILAPIFQALRIEVNKELENLQEVLPKAVEILDKNGRIVVISFHSGEDRIVKNFFRANKGELEILTKKPVVAGKEETDINPRSRSAKLRAAKKV
jgi:16S rRNA (cytosine1402-N4)-methyltransferase